MLYLNLERSTRLQMVGPVEAWGVRGAVATTAGARVPRLTMAALQLALTLAANPGRR